MKTYDEQFAEAVDAKAQVDRAAEIELDLDKASKLMDLLKIIQVRLTDAESARKTEQAPYDQEVKKIRDKWKKVTGPLTKAKALAAEMLEKWLDENDPPEGVRGGLTGAKVQERRSLAWRITDASVVPGEFLTLDDGAVKGFLSVISGNQKVEPEDVLESQPIAGVEFYMETSRFVK